MVKTSKSALKTVINEQAEVAITLDQKVQEAGEMTTIFILVTHTLSGRLQTPNPTLLDKRNVETPYRPPQGDSLSQDRPMAMRAWDVGRSECRAVMARIRVETSPGTKVSPRPTGLTSQENR
jgi:hypothetical protein